MVKQLLHADLVSIAVSKTIATFGNHLIDVFVPLLLLQHGLTLWQVCLFFVAYAVCKLGINYPSVLVINRYGARVGLVVGYIATAVYLVLLTLYITDVAAWCVFGIPLALAITNSFLWNSEHLHVSRVMDTGRKSRDIAMLESLGRLAGIAAPLVGGGLALWLGNAWLVGIAAALAVIAALPIRNADRLAGGHIVQDNVRYNLKHAPMRDLIANFAFNIHAGIGAMVWPVFLAVTLPNIQSIGLITTVASAIAFVLLFVAGARGDKGKNHRILMESTAAVSAGHLLRLFASTPLAIGAVTAFYATAFSYHLNPWKSIYYGHARHGGINYIMSMEIAGDLAAIVLWSGLGILAFITKGTEFLTAAFVIAAVIAWLCPVITREKQSK